MPAHSLLKPLIFAVATVFSRISGTPPAPPPTAKEDVYVDTSFERMVPVMLFVSKNFALAMLIAEAAVHLAVAYPAIAPTATLKYLCPLGHPGPDILATISAPLIVGLGLLVLGTSLRVWCYRTLGRHFTFQVTLLHDHKLVTNGPYAYVRHPGYVGSATLFLGIAMMLLAPHGWVVECGVSATMLGVTLKLWLVQLCWIAYNLVCRTEVEDQNLRSRFGTEWDAYAADVRYKLVPGVY